MKTLKQVKAENTHYKRLISAIISKVGEDSVQDINRHGIDGGFSGFIYYSDTHDFTIKHKKDILLMLTEMADSLGEEPTAMVANFGVFRNQKMDEQEVLNV